MRLISVRVRKFKCIDDSTDFEIDPAVTCLVGKNESGKTAILEALSKINAAVGSGDFDVDVEYPKKEFGKQVPEAGISTEWELDLIDMIAIGLTSTPGSGTVRVRIEKGYDNGTSWNIGLTPTQLVEFAVSRSGLDSAQKADLLKSANLVELVAKAKAIPTDVDGRDAFVELLESPTFILTVHQECRKALESDSLPKFAFFTSYNQLPGRVSVDDFRKRKGNGTLRRSDSTFQALLDAAGVDLNSIVATDTYERLTNRLEAFSATVSETIFKYWSQNRHLRVSITCDAALPGDEPPFNSGRVINIRIRNTRQDVTTKFDERSSGFLWFFSFLVWFDQFARGGGKYAVLLDEPGLTLHARAQRDLLRYFEEQLAPKYQVIYTTHSPFMIDPEHLLRARTVDYVIEKKPRQDERDLGTKVGGDILSTDRDTVFPLQACLGLDITQTLFVGANSLLVEGPSDLLYIKWFQKRLAALGKKTLDSRWTIVACGGADKIETFASLFGASSIRIAALVDFKLADKQKLEALKKSGKLDKDALFRVNDYAGKGEADIEDMLGDDMYVDLVNQAYDLKKQIVLAPSAERIEPRVRQAFALQPPSVVEYDHYEPAKFLNRTSGLAPAGVAAAEVRFEKLFADINGLLPAV